MMRVLKYCGSHLLRNCYEVSYPVIRQSRVYWRVVQIRVWVHMFIRVGVSMKLLSVVVAVSESI